MCVTLGVFAAVVFRCDVIILALPVGASLLYEQRVTFRNLLVVGIAASLLSLGATVLYDSYFWRKWLWPEGIVLFFNTVENKSSEWGVHHPLWYFYSALPRALLATAFLIPVGMIRLSVLAKGKTCKMLLLHPVVSLDPQVMLFVVPVLVFIYLYSMLPHKELRFIFPALPIFNMAAGVGIDKIIKSLQGRKAGHWKKVLVYGWLVGCLGASVAAGLVLFAASFHNYPGGVALQRLHDLGRAQGLTIDGVRKVHIGVAPAMTGITRFLEEKEGNWIYSKQENDINFEEFDFILTDTLEDNEKNQDLFDIVGKIEGFDGLDIARLQVRTAPKIFILQKRSSS